MQAEHTVRATDATLLIILLNTVGLDTRIPEEERNRFLDMSADLDWSRMVRENGDSHRLFPCLHLIIYRLHDTMVEILDCTDLKVEVAIMPCLICCLKVQEYKVLIVKLSQRSLNLTLIVGVGKTGYTRNFDNIQPRVVTDTTDEVDGRDNTSRLNLRIKFL